MRETYRSISVLWVHASSEDRFRQAYENIAEAYDIPGHNDPKTDILVLVRDFLNRKEKKDWIMIIDNADDNELFFASEADDMGMPSKQGLYQYIPRSTHGTVLMTTRTKKAALNFVPEQGSLLIEIGKLAPDDAHRLIQHTLGRDKVTAEQASSLLQSLESLPLALAQALAYMEANSMTIGEYQELLSGGDAVLVDQLCEHFTTDVRDEAMPNAVAAAWVISFEQLLRTDPLAAEFLSVMSLLDRHAILEDFLVTYQTQKGKSNPSDRRRHEDKKARIESLGTLIAYSFITKSTENTYDMHRLVHLVTRRWLVKKNKFDDFVSRATSVTLALYPELLKVERLEMDLSARVLPHARAVVDHQVRTKREITKRAEILYRMGWHLVITWQLTDAERCAAQCHQGRKEHLGASDRYTLLAVQLRLSVYSAQNEPSKMIELAQETLEREREGDYDVIFAITRQLALAYLLQEKLEMAEETLLSCLEYSKAIWGDEHHLTISYMEDLARVYIEQERLDEAQAIFDVVMPARERLDGKDHHNAFYVMHNLAIVHRRRGHHQDAA